MSDETTGAAASATDNPSPISSPPAEEIGVTTDASAFGTTAATAAAGEATPEIVTSAADVAPVDVAAPAAFAPALDAPDTPPAAADAPSAPEGRSSDAEAEGGSGG